MKRRNTHRFHSWKIPALCFVGLRPRTAEFWAKEEGGGIYLRPLKASDPRQPQLKLSAEDPHVYPQALGPLYGFICPLSIYMCMLVSSFNNY